MQRNFVICCDGTSNEFGSENTNVVRLVQALDRDPAKQRLYYDPSVGTYEPDAAHARCEAKPSTSSEAPLLNEQLRPDRGN